MTVPVQTDALTSAEATLVAAEIELSKLATGIYRLSSTLLQGNFSHCISSPNGFEQFVPNNSPGYQRVSFSSNQQQVDKLLTISFQGWQSGPVVPREGPGRDRGRHICYGCSHEERARRNLARRKMNRGKRSVDDFDLIELAGANPNDEIEEKLPIEVICCLFSKSKSF